MAYGDYIAARSFVIESPPADDIRLSGVAVEGFLYAVDGRASTSEDTRILAYELSPTGATSSSTRDWTPGAVSITGFDIYQGFAYAASGNPNPDRVRVYELNNSGATEVDSRSFNLDSSNTDPTALAINPETGVCYVLDQTDDKVYAYELSENGATRRANLDFDLYTDALWSGMCIDTQGLAYFVAATTTVRNIVVYEITASGGIRRSERDEPLTANNTVPTGINIDQGFFYVADSGATRGDLIYVYEHYPSPPEFPVDVGPAQVFIVNQDITPFTIPDAGGVPDPIYSITGLPNGVTFNPNTRVVSGRPTATGQGTAVVTADNTGS